MTRLLHAFEASLHVIPHSYPCMLPQNNSLSILLFGVANTYCEFAQYEKQVHKKKVVGATKTHKNQNQNKKNTIINPKRQAVVPKQFNLVYPFLVG